jgi:hypothetical protein
MFETEVFERIAENLRKALQESQDIRLVPYFAEYFVAYALSIKGPEFGYDQVEVLKRKRGPDLAIRNSSRNISRLIEVKTGHTDLPTWACTASFRTGKSIENAEFHYCVFAVFENLMVKECLIFALDQLKEVAEKKRPYPITAFPNNQCAIFWCENLSKYERIS